MKMTDYEVAGVTITLSTLGQVDITGTDPEALRTLEFLLEQALENVRRARVAAEKEPQS